MHFLFWVPFLKISSLYAVLLSRGGLGRSAGHCMVSKASVCPQCSPLCSRWCYDYACENIFFYYYLFLSRLLALIGQTYTQANSRMPVSVFKTGGLRSCKRSAYFWTGSHQRVGYRTECSMHAKEKNCPCGLDEVCCRYGPYKIRGGGILAVFLPPTESLWIASPSALEGPPTFNICFAGGGGGVGRRRWEHGRSPFGRQSCCIGFYLTCDYFYF